jgi:o-succinylbenzoate synthase
MYITSIVCQRLNVPLTRTFKTAKRTTDQIEDLLVKIETDQGLTGYGSAPANLSMIGETLPSMETVINDFIAPKLIGIKLMGWPRQHAVIADQIAFNSGAKMAIDLAFFDLIAKRYELPLHHYLGSNQSLIETDISISCLSVEKMQTQINEAIEKGFKAVKIKAGIDFDQDMAVLAMLNEKFGEQVPIRIDVNQGWNVKQTLQAIEQLKNYCLNIQLIEQPVAKGDIEALKLITRASPYPIAADESIMSLQDAKEVLTRQACDVINIKLAKCGGLFEAIKIAHLTEAFNKTIMLGCMMESPIGIAAASAFALAYDIHLIDLDPIDWIEPQWYQSHLTFDCPFIALTNNPGI